MVTYTSEGSAVADGASTYVHSAAVRAEGGWGVGGGRQAGRRARCAGAKAQDLSVEPRDVSVPPRERLCDAALASLRHVDGGDEPDAQRQSAIGPGRWQQVATTAVLTEESGGVCGGLVLRLQVERDHLEAGGREHGEQVRVDVIRQHAGRLWEDAAKALLVGGDKLRVADLPQQALGRALIHRTHLRRQPRVARQPGQLPAGQRRHLGQLGRHPVHPLQVLEVGVRPPDLVVDRPHP
eukprot:scaffold4312_cov101-Isochrysis_galbana.AAC.5